MSGLWNELLPTSVDIDGTEYEIRSDYRAALDICMAMSDAELDEQDKAFTMLDIFYPSFDDMPAEHYQQAIERCLWFINCGEEETERQRRAPQGARGLKRSRILIAVSLHKKEVSAGWQRLPFIFLFY